MYKHIKYNKCGCYNHYSEKIGCYGGLLTTESIIMICKKLLNTQHIKAIDIKNNSLGNDGAKVIAELIMNNSNIVNINVSNNKFDIESMNLIVDSIINRDKPINSIIISYNDVGKNLCDILVRLIKSNKVLCKLEAVNCGDNLNYDFFVI